MVAAGITYGAVSDAVGLVDRLLNHVDSRRAQRLEDRVDVIDFEEHGQVASSSSNSPPELTSTKSRTPGSHELVYCLAGSLHCGPDEELLELTVGDTACFDGSLPHVYAGGSAGGRALLVMRKLATNYGGNA